jgi:proteasome lid subunit RPN8/RPN11
MPNYTLARVSGAHTVAPRLVIPLRILERTVEGLRARSNRWRESACVWTGSRDSRITDVLFYHELANDRATRFSLELPEQAKFALYERLAQRQEALLALLHTHPDDGVDLSPVDQRNQVSSRVGFWSIVLPYYGVRDWRIEEIGFHMRCDRGWRRLDVSEVQTCLLVED